MKILVIPDIHVRHILAEKIISYVGPCDQIIFLGDYFDQWFDTPEHNEKTAIWLKESLKNPNRIHLIGNHDVSYIANGARQYFCSGYTFEKNQSINSILNWDDWSKMKVYHLHENILLSHAGLSKFYHDKFNKNGKEFISFLEDEAKAAVLALKSAAPKTPCHRLFEAGPDRGGKGLVGGITWCDLRNFVPVGNYTQIFGHTETDEPYIGEKFCSIDTNLRNFILIEDGKITIKKIIITKENVTVS